MSSLKIHMAAIVLVMVIAAETTAQTTVYDRYKNRQLENMVFERWGGFIPRWYYFLFHNRYRNGPDRRTILQLVPTDAAIWQTERKSEEEKEETEALFNMESFDALNRAVETHYHLHFKAIFDQLNEYIEAELQRAIVLQNHSSALEAFRTEHQRLNDDIALIRAGWLENGDCAEAMQEIERQLRELKGNLIRFNRLQEIQHDYSTHNP
jgi:hypothetical protein